MPKPLVLATCLTTLPFLLSPALAQAGWLDPGFGSGGIVMTPMNPSGILYDLVVQDDGRIVAAGLDRFNNGNQQWVFVRYNEDGSLDPSFGDGGKVVLFGIDDDDRAHDMAIDGLGRIVATGRIRAGGKPKGKQLTNTNPRMATVRLLQNGDLDPSFGDEGLVQESFEGTGTAVRIQPDGRIVVGGWIAGKHSLDFALVRYLEDGSRDPTFGEAASGGGRGKKGGGSGSRTGLREDDLGRVDEIQIGVLELQADGKIVVGGQSGLLGGVDGYFDHHGWVIARYNSDGTDDAGFGADGKIFDDFPMTARRVGGLAFQSDGKILASGRGRLEGGTNDTFDAVVRRYHPDGSVDTGFGVGTPGGIPGLAQTFIPVEVQGSEVALQPDGKIVVAADLRVSSMDSLIAFRFDGLGLADLGFGIGGQSQPAESGVGVVPWAIALDGQGRVLVGGFATSTGTDPIFMIARWFLQ